MTDPSASTNPTSTKDIEEQQRLAAEWRPDVDGPFVGPVQPTTTILDAFDAADPRRTKVQNLAAEFPYYRRMKGDGSCGYRALFFGFILNLSQAYIEARGQDQGGGGQDGVQNPRVWFEDAMRRHVKAMTDRGFDEMIFEDWVETVKGLTTRVGEILDGQGPAEELKREVEREMGEAFNDEEKNMELIQYVRMATSSWLIMVNPDTVAPFIDNGLTVEQWCNRYVDPVASELEDLSMKGVFDAFMEQAGMSLSIHDLEKGEGDKVHVYEHLPGESSGQAKPSKLPSLHVLYRPGHYDLLLRESWA